MNELLKPDRFALLAFNLLVVAVVIYAFVLEAYFPDLFFLSGQEDEYIEWTTFWSFLFASLISFRFVFSERRRGARAVWFLLGLSAFCLLVAMEEISWGQRIIGYQPPEYFLQNNFQQELNLHNVVDSSYRKFALQFIICLYGIVLPLLGWWDKTSKLLERIGVVAPSIELLPAFFVTFGLYCWYPWSNSGEWVELLLGLCFMCSVFINSRMLSEPVGENAKTQQTRFCVKRTSAVVFLLLFVFGLGYSSAAVSRKQRAFHSGNLTAARVELNALKEDLGVDVVQSRCEVHMRLFNYFEKTGNFNLRLGKYSSLQLQGLPKERADYFIDPWNMSYWMSGDCSVGNAGGFFYLYSFGPNRVRDSFSSEIRGDDIGVYLINNK